MCDLTWSPAQAHLLTWAFPGAFVYLGELVSFLLGLLHFGDLVSLLSLPFKAGVQVWSTLTFWLDFTCLRVPFTSGH